MEIIKAGVVWITGEEFVPKSSEEPQKYFAVCRI
jgi:hypothetical protein